ncbi:hypothetical protein V8G54_025384 [Vigna mungo]|uniref:Peptidase M3A/M3B catalytic domain-containing protein n=1 Tax=Vigna mungo TaxID=3915 RepID=A0AAQ3MYW7_VIGMU
MNGAMWRVVSRSSSLIFHSKKRNALSVSVRAFSAPTGLYGFPHLKTAKGFQSFVDEAIQRSGELISYICAKQPASEVMRAMDEISDTVCSVVDSAELCRHTHPDREFVEEASKASMRINEYLHHLNTNHDLYDAIKKAEQECNMLSEEAKRGVRNLRADFERGGINLCSGKLDKVNKLNIEIAQLCREYNENIVMDPGTVDIYPSSRIPRNLHYLVKPIHPSVSSITKNLSGSRGTLKEKGFRITTDPQTVSSVLQFSSDDEVRKMVYIRGNSVPQANVDVLKRLISARHELAQIMGCSSYTEFSIKPNMALSPKVVMSFLLEMSKMVKPKTREEHRLLTKFKREKCGQSDEDLRPWDETYYMTMMKSSAYKLDASVVGSYFSLSNCIEGLKVLVQSLFGATFHSIPLAPNESWDPHVLKLSLHHPEEGDLGYLYLDLYSRKGKYPGCAHFAIKGGRRISQTEYQLPLSDFQENCRIVLGLSNRESAGNRRTAISQSEADRCDPGRSRVTERLDESEQERTARPKGRGMTKPNVTRWSEPNGEALQVLDPRGLKEANGRELPTPNVKGWEEPNGLTLTFKGRTVLQSKQSRSNWPNGLTVRMKAKEGKVDGRINGRERTMDFVKRWTSEQKKGLAVREAPAKGRPAKGRELFKALKVIEDHFFRDYNSGKEIVALVCNFPGSQNPSSVRLNHWEVETLFHEFGHALHSLLSRTDYQHFSGTRAVLDFAEIPSNLFEYYAWDYRVLRKFARHYSTGEEIPQKLVESMQGARDMFAATELQRQIFYALVDQTLFGEQPLLHGDISSVVAELKREHTNYGHVEGTHWETRFSHLLNYGAGYYSYLYAKCFAATIWKKLCEEDPLSSTTGFALRTKFLQHGGAREPDALLNDLMGDGIYRYHDGGIVPDISCLCDEMKLVEEYPLQVHL